MSMPQRSPRGWSFPTTHHQSAATKTTSIAGKGRKEINMYFFLPAHNLKTRRRARNQRLLSKLTLARSLARSLTHSRSLNHSLACSLNHSLSLARSLLRGCRLLFGSEYGEDHAGMPHASSETAQAAEPAQPPAGRQSPPFYSSPCICYWVFVHRVPGTQWRSVVHSFSLHVRAIRSTQGLAEVRNVVRVHGADVGCVPVHYVNVVCIR